ncbi:LysR family transcriptional regulator [Vibrio sp. 99-70-13A1]|uniref:LysR family transcriptional regulator n=1 Tax=Vibrio sp. 99-70-13A1 TaxID=2607601 RepID=UPI0014935CD4|nr:LysR family transcriptional regulator [Vibrio sp. 99-70-13A1]NOH98741.1 LysR family transcriptional regulator [Vibrio sp. 99-70-13A1]
MKHSEFSLIPVFVMVMQELSMSRAAKRLNISQPAVSQCLNRLRAIYNDDLFIRQGNGVTPTAYAKEIYPALSQSMQVIESTTPSKFRFEPKTCERKFSISSLSVFNHTFLPKLSSIIKNEAPLCSVEILPIYNDIESDLRFEKIDLIIEATSKAHPALSQKKLCSDSLCIIYSKSHPRLSENITESEFYSEKHVVHTRSGLSPGYLSDAPNLRDLAKRNVIWEVSSMIDMMPILASSDYIGISPVTIADSYCDFFNLRKVKADFLEVDIEVSMFWHPSKQHDPVHRWFRSCCQESAKSGWSL